jgi:ribokinase
MIVVLGDLIADLSLRIPRFPVKAGDIERAEYMELGPGGATNVAIAAARLGLEVRCLGEVGHDRFGRVVLEGLEREGVDVTGVLITPQAETPVAGVVVDAQGEPAYLGYAGSLRMRRFPGRWQEIIQSAEALFADGWAENEAVPGIILEGMQVARASRVPTFFDPGPGNPEIDRAWMAEAASKATVLLATEDEARSLTEIDDPLDSAHKLLQGETELVVIKRGAAGCLLLTRDDEQIAPGFPVNPKDATGAGDSLDAAIIYGYLKGLSLGEMGTLANAIGAAKVQKLGTGHNMPTKAEIQSVLERFGLGAANLIEGT